MKIDAIMQTAPVIPVLVLDGMIDAAALAETLVEAGLPVLEVTLRTSQALDRPPDSRLLRRRSALACGRPRSPP